MAGASLRVVPAPSRRASSLVLLVGWAAMVRAFVTALEQLRGFWDLPVQLGQTYCKMKNQYLSRLIARLVGWGLVLRVNI